MEGIKSVPVDQVVLSPQSVVPPSQSSHKVFLFPGEPLATFRASSFSLEDRQPSRDMAWVEAQLKFIQEVYRKQLRHYQNRFSPEERLCLNDDLFEQALIQQEAILDQLRHHDLA